MNLTCGRNPWKQASSEDSTYRAYTKSQGFLKTILPLSDELNDILGRIFTRNPDHRITLPELRARILACTRFTEQPAVVMPPTPPASPDHTIEYVTGDDSAVEDYEYDAPLSPADSDSMSDGGSSCSSDEGSLSSSCSSIEDFDDDDFIEDISEVKTPPPQQSHGEPTIFEPEEPNVVAYRQEYLHPYAATVPEVIQHMPAPIQPMCLPKFIPEPFIWERMKCPPPLPQLHHPIPFHYQVPMFAHHLQGCY